MDNNNCFICKKHDGLMCIPGGVVYENDLVYVGHIAPNEGKAYLGYLMIDLKRHAPGLAEMTTDEAKAFGETIQKVSQALKRSEGAEHIYAFVSGDAVPHLHMHLVPRYPGTPIEYWGPNAVQEWSVAPYGGPEEIEKLCKRVKGYLQQ
ncbi:HIT family protein [Bacillus canaveralius]|uniref:HIT family protein n=1 Tax=Bacillus canaveralius TaxID=1403243 RepID=UPI000F767187|nr:HIT family protein [Bacillus canaveralius]RSK52076.1 HIT family protein [Bacillus canaveralius]